MSACDRDDNMVGPESRSTFKLCMLHKSSLLLEDSASTMLILCSFFGVIQRLYSVFSKPAQNYKI